MIRGWLRASRDFSVFRFCGVNPFESFEIDQGILFIYPRFAFQIWHPMPKDICKDSVRHPVLIPYLMFKPVFRDFKDQRPLHTSLLDYALHQDTQGCPPVKILNLFRVSIRNIIVMLAAFRTLSSLATSADSGISSMVPCIEYHMYVWSLGTSIGSFTLSHHSTPPNWLNSLPSDLDESFHRSVTRFKINILVHNLGEHLLGL